jgi:acyl-homoserine-lactone acylase
MRANRNIATTRPILRLQAVLLITALMIAALSISCSQDGSYDAEILWDTWGVPHIFAQDTKSMFYAFGWAQMECHGDLILKLYGAARGLGAEYWGERYLNSDRYIKTFGVPKRARYWYELQHPIFREYLDAFAAGMNAYATSHEDKISDEVKIALPIKSEDILAHLQRVIYINFLAQGFFKRVEQWGTTGSNAWAIAPSHSESGNALLLANPHLPWSESFLLFEAQLKTPDFDVYGASFIGIPLPAFAFNDHIGWTHTVNAVDGMDLYELTLTDNGYRFDGADRSFDEEVETLRIKKPDGSERKEQLVIRNSVHGPVISMKPDQRKALAIRLAGLDKPFLFKQYFDMMQATNLAEFETALQHMQLPLFNVLYADKDGRIMYLFGGLVPKRTQGDRNYWLNIIPGNDSNNLWTETLSYSELPRAVDPPSGWLQNTNDPPWTSTFPNVLAAEDFPAHLSDTGFSLRSQRSVRMLSEDDKISFEELIEYKYSTRLEMADRILDDLIPAARKHGSALANQAADILESWDRCVDKDSKGAVLFGAWVPRVKEDLFAKPWDENNPRTTPDGLADPAAAVAALEEAAQSIISDFGSLNIAWGDLHRVRYGTKDYPANGGPDWLGSFGVLFFMQDRDKKFRSTLGDSYVSVVEFSDPIKAKTLLSYGNASQEGSIHKGDQLELFSKKELRPVWRTKEEIEANLEKKKSF